MVTSVRRLVPLLLAGLLVLPLTGPVAAVEDEPVTTDAMLLQAGHDLVKLTNAKRTAQGLVVGSRRIPP